MNGAAEFTDVDVLLIDGRSGSGKTSLAEASVREFLSHGKHPQLLRVEDLYPGWGGLREGSLALASVLATGRYRRYDWESERFAAEASTIAPRTPLVIEGCGAITAANLAAASDWAGAGARMTALWLEYPESGRRERALARDGATYAPHWDRWAAQEAEHYAEHQPWALPGVVTVQSPSPSPEPIDQLAG